MLQPYSTPPFKVAFGPTIGIRASAQIFDLNVFELRSMATSFQEGYSIHTPPLLNDHIYSHRKCRMKIFLQSIDFDLWYIVNNRYASKPKFEWDKSDMYNFSLNIRAMKLLYQALENNVLYNMISSCTSAYDIWLCLENVHNATNQIFEENNVDEVVEAIEIQVQQPREQESQSQEDVPHLNESNMCLFANEEDEESKKKEIKATWDESNSDSSDEDSSDQEVAQENVVNSKPTSIIETHDYDEFQNAFEELHEELKNLGIKYISLKKHYSLLSKELNELKSQK